MAALALRREERVGLAVAIAAHAALVALLVLRPHAAPVVTPPDRIEVTISDTLAPRSTSPEPRAQAAPDTAPAIGAPPPPEPLPPPPAEPPRPIARPEPPKPVARPKPRPEPPKPVARPKPHPQPPAKPRPHPTARPTPRATAPARPASRSGASSFDKAFGSGIPNAASRGAARNPPAAEAGPEVKSAIRASISARVRGPWNACAVSGVDVEKLRAAVRFKLARNGDIVSIEPPVVTGQTASNAPQVRRFGECAVRAIRTAAPFDLPADSYDFWKNYNLNFRKE
jgi:outer membrane biosynthesis protein TonB